MHRHSACEQVFNVLRVLGKAAFLGVGLKFLDIPACATKINKSLFKNMFSRSPAALVQNYNHWGGI